MTKTSLRAATMAIGVGFAILLTGCGTFFVDPNSPTTPPGSSTADYVYVVNSNSTVSEFTLDSGLTAISGSPFTPGTPLSSASSVVVNPTNSYVFVGGNGGILSYAIGSTGALSTVTNGAVVETANFVSLAVSPNGSYLIGLDNLENAVWVFSIDTTQGVLTKLSSVALPVSVTTAAARSLAVSPNGTLVAVSLGSSGDDVFTFDQTTGAMSTAVTSSVNPPAVGYTDVALAFDPTSGFLLIGRGGPAAGTSQILSYAVSTAGILGAVTTYSPGNDPYALLVETSGNYLYSANKGDGTVSAFGLAAGALTTVAGSPYKGEVGVTALAEDINNKYVVAASTGGTQDLTVYALDALTTGALDPVATSLNGSGVAGSVAVAATHPQAQ